MNQSKPFFTLIVFSLLFLLGSMAALAQGEPRSVFEPSYEVSLQVLIGSNDAATRGAPVPAGLSSITRHLRDNFSFANYRLANTFLGRIANNGNLEYKSISDILGQETDAESRTFLDWSFNGFRTMTDGGRTGFQAHAFRFGARVPVKTGTFKDDTGKINPVINYESIGLTMNRIGLPENTPILAGTLSLPNATGTMFLVITVRSANL